MMNDRWTIMNNSSSELDTKRPNKHKSCCSFLFWSLVVLVVIAAVISATVTILYLNQYPLPFINSNRSGFSSSSSPVISTNPKESGALVSVSRVADGEPISIFLDPNCPDYSDNFLRWEALQSSLLKALSGHNTDAWQDTGLVQKLAEEVKVLSDHAHNLRKEADLLKRGQDLLDQRLEGLQLDQNRVLQVLSDSDSGVLKLAEGFSDLLLNLQRATESLKKHNRDLHRRNEDTADRPRDCSDVMASGRTQDGVYSVFPTHDPVGFMVYCDMMTDGGGWTVIQRREDGSVNFFRGWAAYRDGFGKTTGEHWLGDSLLKHSGMQFTTKDRDLDQSENNCAAYYQGAWWYRNCHTSNLNGQYLSGGHSSYADGVEWSSWTGWQYSLRFTEMKIRPKIKPANLDY
ncbi:Fibrinogen C domain-containing protein 1 [Nibea albiflora]|nr:Fibrinogen C domain-containing protein 1 [Nibea albiflora]